jgi:probable rRNA maturation factor
VDKVKIAIVVEAGDWPPKKELRALAKRAVNAAIQALSKEGRSHPSPRDGGELSLVFTDDAGMKALNARYRGKDRATNVLSFPQNPDPQKAGALLGDVILAEETVAGEAAVADKPLEDHMAHLIIHGFLHLLGFDHEADAEAVKMEQLERVALKTVGISDPYQPANQE